MKREIFRNILILLTLLINSNILGANKYAHASGDWTSTTIWYTLASGGTLTTKPVAGDNAFTNGYNITVSSNEVCNNLTVTSIVDAITINSGSSLTIRGLLTGSGNIAVDAIGGTGTIIFTGAASTSGSVSVISALIGANVTFSNITFNSSKTLTVAGFMKIDGGTLYVQAGTVSSTNQVIGINSAVLTVNSGTTFNVYNTISGGASTNPFPTITVDGTLFTNNYIIGTDISVSGNLNTSGYINATNFTIDGTLSTSNYVNATNLTVNSSGTFDTSFSGDEGWWSATNRPTTTTLDGIVNYSGSDQQIGGNLTYNNLTLSSTGTKTLNDNITVNGLLDIGYDATFNAQSYIVDGGGSISIGDLSTFMTSNPNGIDGVNVTSNGYSYIGYANFVFNGSGAQVTGSLMPDYIQNLTVDNTSSLTLTNSLDCYDITTTTDAQLIVPAGIGLTSRNYAFFAKPLILKTSTTPNRPQMGTFINVGSVSGEITMEMSYTTNGVLEILEGAYSFLPQ